MNSLLRHTRRAAFIATYCLFAVHAPRSHALYNGAGYQALAVSADGAKIAAGGGDGEVCVWDAKAGTVETRVATGAQIYSLAFVGPDGARLAVGTGHGLQIWQRTGDAFTQRALLDEKRTVYGLAISPETHTLALAAESGWIFLYDTATWQKIAKLWEPSNLTSSVVFTLDNSGVITAGNTFTLWDTRPESRENGEIQQPTIQELHKIMDPHKRWTRLSGGPGDDSSYCADLALSPDGGRVVGNSGVARVDGGGQTLQCWDAATGELVWKAKSDRLVSVAYMGDGALVVTGSEDGTLRTWSANDGALHHEWHPHTGAVRGLAAIPRTSTFATAAEDRTVQIWNPASGEKLRQLDR